MTAQELERLMVERYGPDFREKALVGPLGSFRLADAFDECGLTDPRQTQTPTSSPGYGIFQFT